MTIFDHKLLTRECMVFVNGWTRLLLMQYNNICSLIHEKCHPKNYHGDVKYHTTINIIFSVVHVCKHAALIYCHMSF